MMLRQPLEMLLLLFSTTTRGFLFDSIGAPSWLANLSVPLDQNPLLWGVIDPPEDVYLPVGGDLSLNCTLTGYKTPLNASYLYFTKKLQNQPTHQLIPKQYLQVLGPKKIGLKIDGVQRSDSGWYFCALNESSIDSSHNFTSINQISVTVSAPPKAITKLTCISYNYEDMRCDWCEQAQPGVRYDLHWRIGNMDDFYNCTELMHEGINCQCYFPGARYRGLIPEMDHFHLGLLYDMIVVSICPRTFCSDNVHSEHFIINTMNIVKPRPPHQLFISVIDSTTLAVTWTPPPGLENAWVYPLDYIVSYTSVRNPTMVKSNVVINATSLNLTGLHPYTEYNISVVATPSESTGYHSNEKSQLGRTEQSEPSAAPMFLAGSFRINEQKNGKRKVIIFFGEIAKNEVNGLLTGFTITYKVSAENATDEEVFCRNDKHTKQLELETDKAYVVSVAGRTIGNGISSSIYIPRAHDVQTPTYVEGIVSENERQVWFTVILPDDVSVDNYTLLYCHGHMINGIPDAKDCKDGTIPLALTYRGSSNELVFEGHQSDFVYGVAVNYNSSKTSGLSPTWLCLYDYNGDLPQPLVNYPQKQKERSLTLEWKHPKCSKEVRGRTAYFELRLYLKQELIHNVSLPAEYREMMSYTISNLTPYTEYNIVLTACSHVKCGPAYNNSQRSPESVPSGPPVSVFVDHQNDLTKLMWQPPALPNGIITLYRIEIMNSSSETIYTYDEVDGNKTEILISDLPGYTNYSVQIQAVNNAGTSVLSQPIRFSIPIKAPGEVTVKLMLLNPSTIRITVSPPQPLNGPHPELLLIMVQPNINRNYTISEEHDLTLDCSNKNQMVNLSVLAVNTLENGTTLEGPVSKVQSMAVCNANPGNEAVTVGVIFGVVVAVLVLIVAVIMRKRFYCSESVKVLMPEDDANLEVLDETCSTHPGSGQEISKYLKIDETGLNLPTDSDQDSGVSDPQGSDRSRQGSQDGEDKKSQHIRVSSEEDPASSHGSVSSVERQLSNQSVEIGKPIDTYSTAVEAKPSGYHEINDSYPMSSGQSEVRFELSEQDNDHLEEWNTSNQTISGSYKEGLSSSGATDDNISEMSCRKDDNFDGYMHGKEREEEIQFDIVGDV